LPTFEAEPIGVRPWVIARLNLPVSGLRAAVGDDRLVELDLAQLARVGDRAEDLVAGVDDDVPAAGLVDRGVDVDRVLRVSDVVAVDRLRVVGQRRGGALRLAEGVGEPGEDRLVAGRAAVADVRGRADRGQALGDREVELAGLGLRAAVGDDRLVELDLAQLARVGDRAEDLVAGVDDDVPAAGLVDRGVDVDRVLRVSDVVAVDRLRVVGQRRGGALRLVEVVAEPGEDRLVAGRAAVAAFEAEPIGVRPWVIARLNLPVSVCELLLETTALSSWIWPSLRVLVIVQRTLSPVWTTTSQPPAWLTVVLTWTGFCGSVTSLQSIDCV